MPRTLKDYFKLCLKGMAMGAADVVPGVSGGTIAFITGIYQELIATISGVDFSLVKTWKEQGFKSMWKEFNGSFLVVLLSGILISVFTLMRITNYLLETHPILIWSFFFGLIVASVWFVARQIPEWDSKIIIGLLIGAALAFYLVSLPPLSSSVHSNWFFFLAGALAICAMILPGISGAFILVLLGAYKTVTEAAHNFNFTTLGILALGAVVGLLSFSKILKWLFDNYSNLTLAILTGFIAGSLKKIWPWKEILESKHFQDKIIVTKEAMVLPADYNGNPQVLMAIFLMVIGFLLILTLEHFATQKPISENATNKDL